MLGDIIEELIEVKNSFDLVLRIDECSLKDKFHLCNAFDSYEVSDGVQDVLVVDVVEFDNEKFVIRVTLKCPLTYIEINEYVNEIIKHAIQKMENRIRITPIAVKWNHKAFGTVSDRMDTAYLKNDSQRQKLLNKIGIKPSAECDGAGCAKYSLKAGMSYIVKEPKPAKAYAIFVDQVTHGAQGLIITRTNPPIIRENYGLKKTPMVWLTQSQVQNEKCIAPTDVSRLQLIVADFLSRSQNSILLLDGVEYLITQNNFQTVLKFLQLLGDEIAVKQSRMLVSIDPEAIDKRELALFERNMLDATTM
ncbi:MAG: DUF835 domain-containing protein [Thermoplasmata archaeon]